MVLVRIALALGADAHWSQEMSARFSFLRNLLVLEVPNVNVILLLV